MNGNMQGKQLLISDIIKYAAINHAGLEIVGRRIEDSKVVRVTYGEIEERSRKVAQLLKRLGLGAGDCVASIAWNSARHVELYFGVSGSELILHTINPRLHHDQLVYLTDHAEDKVIFVDLNLVPLVESFFSDLKVKPKVVVLTERAFMPESSLDLLCYEELVEAEDGDYEWPSFSEETAAALCYTSGTTGNPKGVLYSHRSTVLHSMGLVSEAVIGLGPTTSVMPVVPMFHVNAWGIPYAAAMTGAKMVCPGAALDGKSVAELMIDEQVTLALGVPTVWLNLLNHLRETGQRLDHLQKVVVGGSAAPRSMIEAFDKEHGTYLMHLWGMTEMSPIGTCGSKLPEVEAMTDDERYDWQTKQGRAAFQVEMKIVDDDNNELPRDGEKYGRLLVRGPWVVERYFKSDESAVDADGWFDTGDVSAISPEGQMRIVDRSKDVIKSGGEWISSIDLENSAVAHSEVVEACVVGIPHPKWDERPLMLVVRTADSQLSKDDLLTFLGDRVAKWWLPDDVVFVDELPHTATGKLHKVPLRATYGEHYL